MEVKENQNLEDALFNKILKHTKKSQDNVQEAFLIKNLAKTHNYYNKEDKKILDRERIAGSQSSQTSPILKKPTVNDIGFSEDEEPREATLEEKKVRK